MSGLVVREMTAADEPAVRELMLRVVEEDFGVPYDPVVHADVDDLAGTYRAARGAFMLLVEDADDGAVVATGGLRDGRLHEGVGCPEHLVRRYRDGRTGQIVRVYVARDHRRRGLAQRLVGAILARTRAERHFDAVCLHTYPHSPGALPFWLSQGCHLVVDDTDGPTRAMFFEFPSPLGEKSA